VTEDSLQKLLLGDLKSVRVEWDIDRVLEKEVVKDSNPGYPWCKLGNTNQEVVEGFREELIEDIMAKVVRMLVIDVEELTSVELVKKGIADVVRVFIKSEPHPREKIDTGRLRLICIFSLAMNTIGRLLFGPMNKLEVDLWRNGPERASCVGMGGSDDDLIKVWSMVERVGFSEISSADVSGWDWTVLYSELLLDKERRKQQLMPLGELQERLIDGYYWCVAMKIFMLSDGTLVEQVVPGILPSGWYCTTSSNTYMRVMVTRLIGSKWSIALGDDSLELTVEGAVRKYGEFGKKLKMYEQNDAEFCSHRWSPETILAPLTSWNRVLYRLLSEAATEERVLQFCYEMRLNTELPEILEELETAGWGGQDFWGSACIEFLKLKYGKEEGSQESG